MSILSDSLARPDTPLRQILHIGRISRAHGLRGEVRVQPMTSDPDRYNGLSECLLVSADEKTIRPIKINSVRSADNQLLIKLQDVEDRNQADLLRGWFLSVRREQAIDLAADEWFICDLIGCSVTDRELGDLGIVCDIQQSTAQDVYVVRKPGEADLLFPALKSILMSVDIAGRRMVVSLPDGLFEVYRRR